jgi:hypothetical protein
MVETWYVVVAGPVVGCRLVGPRCPSTKRGVTVEETEGFPGRSDRT